MKMIKRHKNVQTSKQLTSQKKYNIITSFEKNTCLQKETKTIFTDHHIYMHEKIIWKLFIYYILLYIYIYLRCKQHFIYIF